MGGGVIIINTSRRMLVYTGVQRGCGMNGWRLRNPSKYWHADITVKCQMHSGSRRIKIAQSRHISRLGHKRGAIPAATTNVNHLFEYVFVSRQLLQSDEMEIISASTIRPRPYVRSAKE